MKEFFDKVRGSLFGGSLSQTQVDGLNRILDESKNLSTKHRAYILATAYHETDKTMTPLREYGRGRGRVYGVVDESGKAPYGRGYVQLTWRENYVRADERLGLDGALAQDYDVALDAEVAAKILVRGMSEGWFNKYKLSDFNTYLDMRRVVNGTDRAALIAEHARKFEDALLAITVPDDVPWWLELIRRIFRL